MDGIYENIEENNRNKQHNKYTVQEYQNIFAPWNTFSYFWYLDNLHPGIHFDLSVLGHFGLKYKTIKTNKIHNEF